MVADAVAKQSMWRCELRKQITVLLPTHALLRLSHAQAEALKTCPSRTANRSSTCVITDAAASPNTSERSVLTSRFRADARSSATTGAQLEAELLARGLGLAVGRVRRLKRSIRQRCRLMRGAKVASMLLSGLRNDLIRAQKYVFLGEPF